ncbi:hypothetical protein Taro_015381 [Colocasia esculenta]|uniref:Membrane-associated kinase regulator 2 n=1 Tax=Colocasia esculenta TaxID=4460 RepID=A0A843UHD8_COLES|nr:hypothetical protein [Colocasia esculenta]
MEAFSLLKYWRGGGGAAALSAAATARPAVSITTIAASALPSAEDSDEESADGDDEGPFFDLEFAVPDEECEGDGNEDDDAGSSREGEEREEVTDDEGAAEEREFNFTVSSEGSCGDLRADPSLPLSPSDDLFFKGRLVPLESSSLVFNHGEAHARPHMLPVSLLKTKFRVLMLGLRRPKHVSAAAPAGEPFNGSVPAAAPSPKHPHQRPSKLFTVKFKVEEVPIVSLFTRDNSSRSTGSSNGRSSKQQGDECGAPAAVAGEKKLSKELVQKYINKIKPLYVRVSKRYAEKLRFSGQLTTEGAVTKEAPVQAPTPPSTATATDELEVKSAEAESAPAAAAAAAVAPASGTGIAKAVQKPAQLGNLPAGLRVVCKHLGKSRSASAAVAAVPSPPPTLARRRDDSLLQQQDGIQSAIAHCKMSFNASKGRFFSPPHLHILLLLLTSSQSHGSHQVCPFCRGRMLTASTVQERALH